MIPDNFNVRVYGAYVLEGKLLLTDEIQYGLRMTKLPGGGLEFGEGLEEGLKREWIEEVDAEVEVGELLYVNPFFQRSGMRERDQLLCIYYEVTPLQPLTVTFTEKPMDFPEERDGIQVYRWVDLATFQPDELTFPIDKSFLSVLQKRYA